MRNVIYSRKTESSFGLQFYHVGLYSVMCIGILEGMIMRGVIYARYSSSNQREESIEGQIWENTAYANKHGIEIVGTYIDRALSGKTDNRPEFKRMIKDSPKKGFDVVVVWKLDRFSRDRYDSAFYKVALKKLWHPSKRAW